MAALSSKIAHIGAQLDADHFRQLVAASCLPATSENNNISSLEQQANPRSPLEHELFLLLEKAYIASGRKPNSLWSDNSQLRRQPPAGELRPIQAARCLEDRVRTTRFINAVQNTVQNQRALFPDKKLQVLDAGCGPFAILALAAALEDSNLHVTCLDSNPKSVRLAKALVKFIGLSDRISVIQADARSWETETKFDLIVSETFNAALTEELGWQILSHLNKFRTDSSSILPQSADFLFGVSAAYCSGASSFVQFGSATFNRWDQVYWKTCQHCNFAQPAPTSLAVKISLATLAPARYQLFIGCDFQLSGLKISGYDSALSAPLEIAEISFKVPCQANLVINHTPGGNRADIKFSLESDGQEQLLQTGRRSLALGIPALSIIPRAWK